MMPLLLGIVLTHIWTLQTVKLLSRSYVRLVIAMKPVRVYLVFHIMSYNSSLIFNILQLILDCIY